MKIELGKTYVNREGKEITITEFEDEQPVEYPYLGDNNISYTSEGRYILGKESKLDLIEFKFTPRVGGKYLTRDGHTVELEPMEDFLPFIFRSTDGNDSYTEDGLVWEDGTDEMDLIMEIPELISHPILLNTIHQATNLEFVKIIKINTSNKYFPLVGDNGINYSLTGGAELNELHIDPISTTEMLPDRAGGIVDDEETTGLINGSINKSVNGCITEVKEEMTYYYEIDGDFEEEFVVSRARDDDNVWEPWTVDVSQFHYITLHTAIAIEDAIRQATEISTLQNED